MSEAPAGYTGLRPLWQDEIGTTYEAREAASGHGTGLRVLRVSMPGRQDRHRFRDACLAVTAMTPHPGILTLHEVGFTGDHHPFLVTDVPRGSLAGRLAASGPLPRREAAALGQALADTLATAHGHGLLHQDVRPENVVRADGPAPLLTDFGVTRAALAAGAAELSPGSLVHAAREVFGWETPGPPADVHGLASTIYTMLAGQPPYQAEALLGRPALYQRVLRGTPPPVPAPGIPAAFSALLADMMAPDPASRPRMDEVAEALAEFAAEAGAAPAALRQAAAGPAGAPSAPVLLRAPGPATPPAARDGHGHRYTGLLLLIALGTVALLAGVVWGALTVPRTRPGPVPTPARTAAAVPLPPGEQASYRPRQLRVSSRAAGIGVAWAAPPVSGGVSAYIVIAERGGQAAQERTVVGATHRTAFTGLLAGQRYCVVVGSLLERASGQPATAAAAPVCITVQP